MGFFLWVINLLFKNWRLVVAGLAITAAIWIFNDWQKRGDTIADYKKDLQAAENSLRAERIKYQAGMVALNNQRSETRRVSERIEKYEKEIEDLKRDHDRPVGPVLQHSHDWLLCEYDLQGPCN